MVSDAYQIEFDLGRGKRGKQMGGISAVATYVKYIFSTNRSRRIVVHRVDKDTRPMAILV